MQFKLEITMDNDAFTTGPESDGSGTEVAEILGKVEFLVDGVDLDIEHHGNLKDHNGNSVGYWVVTE
jgi:hypothetical protein